MHFDGFETVNDIKKRYRQLCFIYHPDVGGTNEAMKQLNKEYLEALALCDGQSIKSEDGKDHYYYYHQEVEQAIIDKINEILHLKLRNINILLVGTWIWISGETKPIKDKLKAIKCQWHSKRNMWYWHTKSYKRHYSGIEFDTICNMYGLKEYEQPEEKSLIIRH